MTIQLQPSQPIDLPFMKEILYKAVFWRDVQNRPSLKEALSLPDVAKALADWGGRDGDTALIATQNGTPVGAVWYRYWTAEDEMRGYMDDKVPVLVVGIHADQRGKGIGTLLIEGLVEQARKDGVLRVSLMVSKDNYALKLYEQQGFEYHSETEDSITMVREV